VRVVWAVARRAVCVLLRVVRGSMQNEGTTVVVQACKGCVARFSNAGRVCGASGKVKRQHGSVRQRVAARWAGLQGGVGVYGYVRPWWQPR